MNKRLFLILLISTALLISMNIDMLNSQLNDIIGVALIIKINTIISWTFLPLIIAVFWLIIVYLIHLSATLFGGSNEFSFFLFHSWIGLLPIFIAGLVDFFLINQLIAITESKSFENEYDLFNYLENNLLFLLIKAISFLGQTLGFIALSIKLRQLYGLTTLKALLSTAIVYLLLLSLNIY